MNAILAKFEAVWAALVAEEHKLAGDVRDAIDSLIHHNAQAAVTIDNTAAPVQGGGSGGSTTAQAAEATDPAPQPPAAAGPVVFDPTKYPDAGERLTALRALQAQHPMGTRIVDPQGNDVDVRGNSIAPTTPGQDGPSIARARAKLDSFGQPAIVHGKGAIPYHVPTMPGRAISAGQIAQAPGFSYPSQASIWWGASADAPKPDGLVAGIDANNVLPLSTEDGFICYESDTGGEFMIQIGPA